MYPHCKYLIIRLQKKMKDRARVVTAHSAGHQEDLVRERLLSQTPNVPHLNFR
jgi:hypothetical protein